ncbi:MAG: class I SAM-dependent methyltransferase [Chitinispirillaceae bacterium]|nr:class I SAM-dependent methyltransferase [Chitinispirillaceae bacterium]
MLSKLNNDPVLLSHPGSKRDYNRLLFAEVAPKYSRITRLLSFFRDTAWKKFLISQLPESIDGPVLDIATGTGDLPALAASRWPDARLIGCDISLDMLSHARRPFGSTLLLSCQDMASLAVGTRTAAIITGGYALRNAPDIRATLGECFRVLKPGGTAGFLDFSRSPNAARFRIGYWILRLWGGFWGLVMHGNPAVYAYIAESLSLYPDRETLRSMLAETGFVDISFHRRMGGLIDIIIVHKAAQPASSKA